MAEVYILVCEEAGNSYNGKPCFLNSENAASVRDDLNSKYKETWQIIELTVADSTLQHEELKALKEKALWKKVGENNNGA
jgi:hypothetical protein